MIAEKCLPCLNGLHQECYEPGLAEPEEVEDKLQDDAWLICCCQVLSEESRIDTQVSMGIGRPVSEPSDITDITSTGRKRAAMLYPIYDGMVCEWAGLRYAGGGVQPIIGCPGNTLSSGRGEGRGDRHHGPDKNVINNAPGNVHRICSPCHNRYHARNNRYYAGERPAADQPWLPTPPEGGKVHEHDAETLASEEEIAENEEYWAKHKAQVDTTD